MVPGFVESLIFREAWNPLIYFKTQASQKKKSEEIFIRQQWEAFGTDHHRVHRQSHSADPRRATPTEECQPE